MYLSSPEYRGPSDLADMTSGCTMEVTLCGRLYIWAREGRLPQTGGHIHY